MSTVLGLDVEENMARNTIEKDKTSATLNKNFNDHAIKNAACGYKQILYVFENGSVFYSGWNGADDVCAVGETICQVAAAFESSFAITTVGQVFRWGSSKF